MKVPSPTHLKISDWMKKERPGLFSDTRKVERITLSKDLLNFHLENLTTYKKEFEFEEFCRRLLEKEICPNLRPQTGPTGGGDSKTDSSTYPVSPVLALRTYWSNPNPATEGSWAFAFSCKKDWKSKVNSDLEKISKLERSFSKVFFVTNQPVKDKSRAALEDGIKDKYTFELVLLDRTWLTARVIEHKHEKLAAEALGLDIGEQIIDQLGPNDTERQKRLEVLLEWINDPSRYHGNDYALAEDYLEGAKLAATLQRPRHEVDGLFSRALAIAKTAGHRAQILRCGFQYAWRCLCFFDDFEQIEPIYKDIEPYIVGTESAEDCLTLGSLLAILSAGVKFSAISEQAANLHYRYTMLRTQIDRISLDSSRPNNSLNAKTIGCMLELGILAPKEERSAEIFKMLKKCFKESAGMGTYPLMQFIDFFQKLGKAFGETSGFSELFDEMRRITKGRIGEVEEGKLLLERGLDLLGLRDSANALKYLGMARVRLSKKETEEDLIRAGLATSDAYADMGLLWAARMEALGAAHVAMATLDAAHQYSWECALIIKRLAWLELRLGRIAPFLTWHKFAYGLLEQIVSIDYRVDKFLNDLKTQDQIFGALILNIDQEHAYTLRDLTESLKESPLIATRMALLYTTGEIDAVRKMLSPSMDNLISMDQLNDFIEKWKKHKALKKLPAFLIDETRSTIRYSTTLMGVEYIFVTENKFPCILFAENLISLFESGLALAKWETLAFIAEKVTFRIKSSDSGANPPIIDWENSSILDEVNINWTSNFIDWMNAEGRAATREFVQRLFFHCIMITTIDPVSELDKEFSDWKSINTFERAFSLSPTSIIVSNLVKEEYYDINYWLKTATS